MDSIVNVKICLTLYELYRSNYYSKTESTHADMKPHCIKHMWYPGIWLDILAANIVESNKVSLALRNYLGTWSTDVHNSTWNGWWLLILGNYERYSVWQVYSALVHTYYKYPQIKRGLIVSIEHHSVIFCWQFL